MIKSETHRHPSIRDTENIGKINVDQKREVENRAMNGDEAAVKMQASWRGYAGRKTLSHLTVPVHDDRPTKEDTSRL